MGFFSNIFSRFMARTMYIGGSSTHSKSWNGEIEKQDICTSILDCNACHTAKAQVLHVIVDDQGRVSKIQRNSEFTKLFQRPNPYMSGYDFLYAMSWQLDLKNTALAWIKWDDRHLHPLEIWPIAYQQYDIMSVAGGGYAVKFFDMDGLAHELWLSDVVILRRHFDGSGPSGGTNTPVDESITLVQSIDSGIEDAVNVSNKVHGILRQKKAMLNPTDVQNSQNEFVSRMKAAASNGGIVTTDSMEDYIPLTVNAWAANSAQMSQITDRLYGYWRTPREIVMGTASEQVVENYYDGIIEPRWQAIGQALTAALFSTHSQDFGNRIMVFGNSADGMSWQTKINIIAASKETALLTINEQRSLMGYPPVEDGDVRQVSLNYIKSTDQSHYQTGKDAGDTGGTNNAG